MLRLAAGLLLLCTGVTTTRLNGQSLDLQGERVRITVTDRTPGRLVGTVIRQDQGSLVLGALHGPVVIPWSQVSRVDVSRGHRSALARGAARGVLGGLAAGIVVGGIACLAYDIAEGTCLNSNDGGQAAFYGPLIVGTAGGLVIGSVVGLMTRTERWESRPLSTIQPSVGFRPGPGPVVAIGVRW